MVGDPCQVFTTAGSLGCPIGNHLIEISLIIHLLQSVHFCHEFFTFTYLADLFQQSDEIIEGLFLLDYPPS